jgi:hypothetical protein
VKEEIEKTISTMESFFKSGKLCILTVLFLLLLTPAGAPIGFNNSLEVKGKIMNLSLLVCLY